MAIYNGTIDNVGALTISQKAVLAIKTACEAEGWTTVEYVSSGANHIWVGRSTGLSGTEEIFIAARSYDVSMFSKYVLTLHVLPNWQTGVAFASQDKLTSPWAIQSDTPNWIGFGANPNSYYLFVNDQRIIWLNIKNTDTVSAGYAGKFFPFARPDQYPLPLLAMYAPDDAQTFFYGQTLAPGLVQYTPSFYPNAPTNGIFSSKTIREVDGIFGVHPVYVMRYSTGYLGGDILGQLDGVYQCTGDNLQNLSVIQIGGSVVVNQTGMTIMAAIAAIDAVGGDAYLACYTGTLRGHGDAFCIKCE